MSQYLVFVLVMIHNCLPTCFHPQNYFCILDASIFRITYKNLSLDNQNKRCCISIYPLTHIHEGLKLEHILKMANNTICFSCINRIIKHR